jgi:hypothetical protein
MQLTRCMSTVSHPGWRRIPHPSTFAHGLPFWIGLRGRSRPPSAPDALDGHSAVQAGVDALPELSHAATVY